MAIKKILTGWDFCECPPCEERHEEIYPTTILDQVLMEEHGDNLQNWIQVDLDGNYYTTLHEWLVHNYPTGGTGSTYQTSLNGQTYGSGTSLGSWYAPTVAGTEHQILEANSNGIPVWTTIDSVLGANGNTGKYLTVDNNGHIVWNSASFTQAQANWNETNTNDPSYIKNKPTIPAAANNSTITIDGGIIGDYTTFGSFTTNQNSNTTIHIPDMRGANGTNPGTRGLVPAPAKTDNVNFLRGDGQWAPVSGGTSYTTLSSGAHATGTSYVVNGSGYSSTASKFLREDGTWQSVSGSGTVTSVGLSAPTIFSVTNSPITTSGTIAINLTSEQANTVFAGPNTGSAQAPTFRLLDKADIPALDLSIVAAPSDTSAIDLAANTKYKLSVGSSDYIFKTPPSGGSGGGSMNSFNISTDGFDLNLTNPTYPAQQTILSVTDGATIYLKPAQYLLQSYPDVDIDVLGGVRLGYDEDFRHRALQLDSNDRAYVNLGEVYTPPKIKRNSVIVGGNTVTMDKYSTSRITTAGLNLFSFGWGNLPVDTVNKEDKLCPILTIKASALDDEAREIGYITEFEIIGYTDIAYDKSTAISDLFTKYINYKGRYSAKLYYDDSGNPYLDLVCIEYYCKQDLNYLESGNTDSVESIAPFSTKSIGYIWDDTNEQFIVYKKIPWFLSEDSFLVNVLAEHTKSFDSTSAPRVTPQWWCGGVIYYLNDSDVSLGDYSYNIPTNDSGIALNASVTRAYFSDLIPISQDFVPCHDYNSEELSIAPNDPQTYGTYDIPVHAGNKITIRTNDAAQALNPGAITLNLTDIEDSRFETTLDISRYVGPGASDANSVMSSFKIPVSKVIDVNSPSSANSGSKGRADNVGSYAVFRFNSTCKYIVRVFHGLCYVYFVQI